MKTLRRKKPKTRRCIYMEDQTWKEMREIAYILSDEKTIPVAEIMRRAIKHYLDEIRFKAQKEVMGVTEDEDKVSNIL